MKENSKKYIVEGSWCVDHIPDINNFTCNNSTFGDPAIGKNKGCGGICSHLLSENYTMGLDCKTLPCIISQSGKRYIRLRPDGKYETKGDGWSNDQIMNYIKENKIIVDYIALTHGHYDHIDYVEEYASAFKDAKIICAKEELKVIGDPEANLSVFFGQRKKYECDYIPLGEQDKVSLPKNDGTCVDFSVIISPVEP